MLQPSSPLAESGETWSLSEVLPAQFLNASRQGWQFGTLGGHALRVAAFSYAIAQSYGLHPRVCERLRRVATFHDIGKIFLSEALLNKPGPLTPSERRDIENHTVLGYELLLSSSLPTLREAAVIAFCHHERMDGLGYPRKRLGHEIPLGARIVSVADVFDALTSTRSYRPAMSEAQAAEIIRQGGGSQFDSEVVSAFSSVLERYPRLGQRIRWFTQDWPEPLPALLKNTLDVTRRTQADAAEDWLSDWADSDADWRSFSA